MVEHPQRRKERMPPPKLTAPFPWFGGKRRCADIVWQRFGDVGHYVEPFAGSLAVLLGRPSEPHLETVNDLDAFLANFWRAVKWAPEETAKWADSPVNEADLFARHTWLVTEGAAILAETDPHDFDAKVAGWWSWGVSAWVGSGWCHARPWGNVHRQLPKVHPRGVHRKRPHLQHGGKGVHRKGMDIYAWFEALSNRLRCVAVCCGDWKRVLTAGVIDNRGYSVGVFLDPPYGGDRRPNLYVEDSMDIAADCRARALELGRMANVRVALCGLEGEHNPLELEGWSKVSWSAAGGYAGFRKGPKGSENRHNERIWFSPHCLDPQPCALEQSGAWGRP